MDPVGWITSILAIDGSRLLAKPAAESSDEAETGNCDDMSGTGAEFQGTEGGTVDCDDHIEL